MDGFLVILKFQLNFLVDEIEVNLDNLYDIASSLLFTVYMSFYKSISSIFFTAKFRGLLESLHMGGDLRKFKANFPFNNSIRFA